MTLVGKIFTVLILIMSVLFLGFSIMVFATHTNWKDQAAELETELEVQAAANTNLTASRDSLQRAIAMEQAARRFALAGLQAKLQSAEEQLRERERILQNLTATEGTTAATLETTQNLLSSLTDEVQTLRTEIRTAQQDVDTQFAEMVRLTDEINQARRLQNQLEDRQDPLLRQIAALQSVLAKLGVNFEVDTDGTVRTDVDRLPPTVDGVVVTVGENDRIEISIGSDDGLLPGHELDVFRQGAYLGRVTVLRTDPDRAVAEILPEFKKGIIRRGDRVATKLG